MKLRILAAWFALVSLPVSAAENLRDYPDLPPLTAVEKALENKHWSNFTSGASKS